MAKSAQRVKAMNEKTAEKGTVPLDNYLKLHNTLNCAFEVVSALLRVERNQRDYIFQRIRHYKDLRKITDNKQTKQFCCGAIHAYETIRI
jgi:hypothetical protein